MSTREEKRAEREARKAQKQLLNAARSMRRDMLKFCRDERFAQALAAAVPVYWDSYYTIETADEMDMNESMRFFDWFLFDYPIDEDGRYLVEIYAAEKREEFGEREQMVLDSWLSSATPPSAYEYLDFDGFSQMFKLRDFFTDTEIVAFSAAGSGLAKKGDLILTRLLPVGDEIVFSTVGAYIPKDEVDDLSEKLAAAREADAVEHPDATHEQFLRRHSQLIIHHGLSKSVDNGRFAVSRLDPSRVDKAVKRTAKKMAKKFKRKKKR